MKLDTRHKYIFFLIFSLWLDTDTYAQNARALLDKGWQELVKDNDTSALHYFNLAYEQAGKEKDTVSRATSLLNMGICYYSVSYSKGMEYCMLAMKEYRKLERLHPEQALEGRSKCLQLISTIHARQGKYREAIVLSQEARAGFPPDSDTTGYLGLVYNSLGSCYGRLGLADSSEFYHRLALSERLRTRNFVYLPGSYQSVAEIELAHGNKQQSLVYFQRAFVIADSTGNRQAQVSSLLGLGKWYLEAEKNEQRAEAYYTKAKMIASGLTDKAFYLKTLGQLITLKKQQGDYKAAFAYKDEMQVINDTIHTWDKQHAIQILEVQFDVAEKDRKLRLAQKEKEVTKLTNYLLGGSLLVLLAGGTGIFIFLRRINKRDKQLLQTREALMVATEEQKRLKERQMQHEIEFRESQLSAMTLQMLQKNELLQELKERMDQDRHMSQDQAIHKIINKGLNQDKDWSDFNTHFESINRNFYTRLKQAYPGISPNDLKICALIKMNLSIKEMAAILNISPESVKTARYRLRKKLQMNTEDNLTEFIMHL